MSKRAEKQIMDRRVFRAAVKLNELIKESHQKGWPVTVELYNLNLPGVMVHEATGVGVHPVLYHREKNSSVTTAAKSSISVASIDPSSSAKLPKLPS